MSDEPVELKEEDLRLVSGGFSFGDFPTGNFVHIVQFSNTSDPNVTQSVTVVQSN